MRDRKELNKLVVVMISSSQFYPTASELYSELRTGNTRIIKEEGVKSFKGFVKIINSFKEIEPEGKRGEPMVYKVKRQV